MRVEWPKRFQPKHVIHPVNTEGTTWLRESDLVFVNKRPYAVLKWAHGERGDVPEVYIELKPKLLKHEPHDPAYRYEAEVPDPTSSPRRS